ncbi:hypothetical protein [Embleya sp. NPDC059237]|uniref:hypothetical protein n=1 Tax=Embleya sp. NPDC059237 TaxID=3346784 RepID=UPI0036A60155
MAPQGRGVGYAGPGDFVTPHALRCDGPPGIVARFRHAAESVRRTGFDDVEGHGVFDMVGVDGAFTAAARHRPVFGA